MKQNALQMSCSNNNNTIVMFPLPWRDKSENAESTKLTMLSTAPNSLPNQLKIINIVQAYLTEPNSNLNPQRTNL